MSDPDNDGCTWLLASIALGLLALLAFSVAWGAPPEGADPNSPIGQWFQSLKQPGTDDVSCCSIADCRPVDYRIEAEVAVDGKWLPVPPNKIVHRENPTGRAVLCKSRISETIWCFVPASET